MVDPTIRQGLTAYANGAALADVIDQHPQPDPAPDRELDRLRLRLIAHYAGELRDGEGPVDEALRLIAERELSLTTAMRLPTQGAFTRTYLFALMAAVLRAYADEHHHYAGAVEPIPDVQDADRVCSCGAAYDDEDGCAERRELLTVAARYESTVERANAAGRGGEPVPPALSADLLLRQRDALLELARDLVNRLSVSLGEDGAAEWRRRLGEATPAG